MSGVYGYPPPPYGGSYGYPPGYGYPGYGTPTGAPPGSVPQDQFSQGYQQGSTAVGGTAGQMANWGNTLTNTAVTTYGTMNTVVGTTANVLGTLSNTLTGLFGGFGSYGATTGGSYQQPAYGQYPQAGQTYGPAWGADMQQAQAEAYQRAMSSTRAGQVGSAIDDYADAAASARQQMQQTVDQANTAIRDLQAAVGRLQQQGGVSSPQGQAMLAEIQSLRGRATQALTQVDQAARAVYINAFKAQVAFWAGSQRFPNLNSSSVTSDIGRAWAAYNGAPTERAHWYSLSKSPVPNAVTMQNQARSQVTQSLQQLDRMLQQAYQQQSGSATGTTTTTATSSTQFLPR